MIHADVLNKILLIYNFLLGNKLPHLPCSAKAEQKETNRNSRDLNFLKGSKALLEDLLELQVDPKILR